MKLPFQVEPKPVTMIAVGTADTGVLQIKKINGLTVLEQRFIKAQSLPDVQKRVARLARDIATRSGFPFVAVYDEFVARINGQWHLLNVGDRVTVTGVKRLADKIGTIRDFIEDDKIALVQIDEAKGEPEKIELSSLEKVSILDLGDCLSEIKDCQALLEESMQRRQLVYATAIARYRLSCNADEISTLDGFLAITEKVLTHKFDQRLASDLIKTIRLEIEEAQEIFNIEAMSAQDPALVSALAEFAENEETGWKTSDKTGDKTDGEPTPPEPTATTEEALGKS